MSENSVEETAPATDEVSPETESTEDAAQSDENAPETPDEGVEGQEDAQDDNEPEIGVPAVPDAPDPGENTEPVGEPVEVDVDEDLVGYDVDSDADLSGFSSEIRDAIRTEIRGLGHSPTLAGIRENKE